MKKIALITTNIAPYRLRWCEELSKYYEVEIYHTKDKEIYYDDRFLKHKSNKVKITKLNNKNDNGLDPLCFDVIEIIKNNKNSLIIFDGYGPKTNLLGLVYAKINGIKTYVNVDGYPTERKINILLEKVRRFVITNLCDYFFCGGENVRDYLIKYGARKENICVHNFSSVCKKDILKKPLTKAEKNRIRKELCINAKGNVIVGVGRFVPLKRFVDLILAAKQCNSECQLYLIGGKPTKEYIDIYNNNVHYVDFVLPEDVYKYYMAADLFVLPSETDVWGLVINEAMSKGLPIISSDSPVAAKNLIDGNGIIYKTYDVDELSKAIDICLDKKNNSKMSKQSLVNIKEYTIENMVKRQKPFIDKYFDSIK